MPDLTPAQEALVEMGRIRTRVRHLSEVRWRELPDVTVRMHLADLRRASALLRGIDHATNGGDDD